MKRPAQIGVVVFALLAGIRDAAAQPNECRVPAIGVSIGVSGNGDRNAGINEPDSGSEAAIDFSAVVEYPLIDRFSVRGNAGTVRWPFLSRNFRNEPEVFDRVRIDRVSLSWLKRTESWCLYPLFGYVGGGIGLYRYRFAGDGTSITRPGVHLMAGLDIPVGYRLAVNGEVGFEAARGPDQVPVFSHILFMLRATVGMRLRFG